jgi:outer membrane immunogenic protein
VAVVSDWTGWYGGIHFGGTWGSTGAFDLDGYSPLPGPLPPGPPLPPGDHWNADTAGFVAGGQLGYNWQVGVLLLGLEGDVGDLGLNGSANSNAPFVNGDLASRTEADFYLTALVAPARLRRLRERAPGGRLGAGLVAQ